MAGTTCTLDKYKQIFRVVFKPRKNYNRAYLVVSLAIEFAENLAIVKSPTTLFLKRDPILFSDRTLGYFIAYTQTLGAIGTVMVIYVFKKLLHSSDLLLIIFSNVFLAVFSFLFGFTISLKTVFIVGALQTFTHSSHPAGKAFMAKLVEPMEIGKLFAFMTIVEKLKPLVSSLIYDNLYAYVIQVGLFPGLVFVVAGIMAILSIMIVSWMYLHAKYKGNLSEDEHMPTPEVTDSEEVVPDL